MKITNTDYGRNKGIILSGEDTKLLDSLLASPLMRDRMPTVVRGRRNRMVLWAVKELKDILSKKSKPLQTYLNF